jgi:predicted hotdog family 3-hydroxylacyl-ACP dehydratase
LLTESVLPKRIGRDWIARHIPHHAAMCLIDDVTAWDAEVIHCTTQTHTHIGNPLRADGRLGAICGVEYAAQAVAIHRAILLAQQSATASIAAPLQGYLAALRDLETLVERLDAFPQPLEIVASRYAALDGGAIYDFIVRQASSTLQTGRITLKTATLATGPRGVSP